MLSIANALIDRKTKTELNAIGQLRVQPVPPEFGRRRGAEEVGQDAPRMTTYWTCAGRTLSAVNCRRVTPDASVI
jgi:hypothetical protein